MSSFHRSAAAVLLLSCLVVSAGAAGEEGQASTWKKLTSEPPLPAELQADADAFPMASVQTWRNPLSFAPFRVAKLKNGWVRISERGQTEPVKGGEISGRLVEAKQKFSFTLEEAKAAQWQVQCGWYTVKESLGYEGRRNSVSADLGGEGSLQCTFARPGEAPSVTLDLEAVVTTKGLGASMDADASLRGSGQYYTIEPLFAIKGSRVIGDVPQGWVFTERGKAVAALQSYGQSGHPVRFTAARSLPAEKRSLLAAATAALVTFEKACATDPID